MGDPSKEYISMKLIHISMLGIALFISACATTSSTSSNTKHQEDVKKFSMVDTQGKEIMVNEDHTLLGWFPWALTPSKNKTSYTLQRYQGKTVIHADADASASGLMVPLKPRTVEGKELIWEWKTLGHIESADNTQGHTDDAPLRLILAFDGDKSKLSLKDQIAFELAHLISGQEMPYATLMYIWSSQAHETPIITNKYTSRLKMIIVDSGEEHVGQWRKYQRNIEEDYREAFQEAPGKLIAVGIMTDTDNTKSLVKAIYGDIEIKRK
jgi:Protein of unknown function (DUF3047)